MVNYFNTIMEPTSKTPFQEQITALMTSVSVDGCHSLQLDCMGHLLNSFVSLNTCHVSYSTPVPAAELENIGNHSDNITPETQGDGDF